MLQEQQRQAADGQCGASAVNKSLQGYFFGKPMLPAEFEAFIRKRI